ncbi:MAG: phosphoribosyltransferase-like protein [Verrucomicrobiales bacterium]
MTIGKKLSFGKIENSPEIREWLSQFSSNDVLAAKSLLSSLQFISWNEFADWLESKLTNYADSGCSTAVYAVRKFRKNAKYLWSKQGATQHRPAQTQGSEDLVSSVISKSNKGNKDLFLDHPSLTQLRSKKVRNIVLVDDSIGSGKRVADFIKLMTNCATFLSWWSGGYVRIHVVSYARTTQAERVILESIPGSDHGLRKHPISSKVKFDSDIVYDARSIRRRWGSSSQPILSLCSSVKKIAKDRRKGFGDIMGNLVFYHSVPNNIPGMLYSRRKGWKPLFPDRSLPQWVPELLEHSGNASQQAASAPHQLEVSENMGEFLHLVKAGIRTTSSLSRRLDCSDPITQGLIAQAVQLGFISSTNRLLKAGENYLHEKRKARPRIGPDYLLYIPQSWCAGRETVQPSDHDASGAMTQTDSIDPTSMDGGGGESPLERTDAMAPSSPIRDVPQHPSWARERHIPNGPTGLKE